MQGVKTELALKIKQRYFSPEGTTLQTLCLLYEKDLLFYTLHGFDFVSFQTSDLESWIRILHFC